jgi:hypothetical protein
MNINNIIMETYKGIFSGNRIYQEDGSEIDCATYGSVKNIIEGTRGFFNLEPNTYGDLIIKQYAVFGENDMMIIGEHL